MSVFLTISDDRVIYKGDFFFMIYDAYPVSKNHLLIISNELREDYFSLTEEEQQELPKMINKAKSIIEEEIDKTKVSIQHYKELTKPIAPPPVRENLLIL